MGYPDVGSGCIKLSYIPAYSVPSAGGHDLGPSFPIDWSVQLNVGGEENNLLMVEYRDSYFQGVKRVSDSQRSHLQRFMEWFSLHFSPGSGLCLKSVLAQNKMRAKFYCPYFNALLHE